MMPDHHPTASSGNQSAETQETLAVFATAALAGLLAHSEPDTHHPPDPKQTASLAWAYARAMLDERERLRQQENR